MSKKSNVLTIRLPRDLKDRIEKAADLQGVSMNQFAIYTPLPGESAKWKSPLSSKTSRKAKIEGKSSETSTL